uniref:Anthranilate synthase component 1 n=1 Tax=Buchnera aphidicola subsp. Tetraneura caerulescens TaxID=118111 RepID=TRPE_BUCTC|nr:anthranilate synthase component 1 [Buchnera aphidicola]Q9ZES2.1 RecName: Full=Anthranilate synthase component 1; Short=AS; Short=ASI [Buchnera aphidicola (Tetraneura caerulescens)]CAA09993.1 anthranilate synthase large subunit [Buchnera aphidicola]
MYYRSIKSEIIQTICTYHEEPSLIFNKICRTKTETLLLESATVHGKKNIESMLIIDTAIKISCFKNIVEIEAISNNGLFLLNTIDLKILKKKSTKIKKKKSNVLEIHFPIFNYFTDEDKKLFLTSVFDALRIIKKSIKNPEKSKMGVFFGGILSYDLISSFEPIPRVFNSKYNHPDFCFYLSENLLIFDHKKKKCKLQTNIFTDNEEEKLNILKRIKIIYNQIKEINSKKKNNRINTFNDFKTKNKKWVDCKNDSKVYKNKVKKMKQMILNGEVFQIVISRKFFLPCPYPLESYIFLKKNNPSPYMFFMQDRHFVLFGASPESSLKFSSITRKIEIHPIAGTRPRAFSSIKKIDINEDNKMELAMRINSKELAEHCMLVDLARNDLSRICLPGSRVVSDLMKVVKYSHVMHLVSKVEGVLRNDLDIFHAYQCCMNMGTLTGAPKIRAMQIIAEEGEIRECYGGAIGYFTGKGDLDTCIVIRSAYVRNGIACVQAGAGIVLDSIADEENEECKNKAMAVINAINKTL